MDSRRQQQANIYREVERLRIGTNGPTTSRHAELSCKSGDSIAAKARSLITSERFISAVSPALLDENWDDMFPEAIQAKTVGVVTRSLVDSSGFEDLIYDTNLMAWAVLLMTSPDDLGRTP